LVCCPTELLTCHEHGSYICAIESSTNKDEHIIWRESRKTDFVCPKEIKPLAALQECSENYWACSRVKSLWTSVFKI